MARFLVTYHGHVMPSDPEEMEQAKAAFGEWVMANAASVLDPGAPVLFGAQVHSGMPQPQAQIGGYSIVRADDVAGAEAVLASHPYVGRGGTLQVNQILEVG